MSDPFDLPAALARYPRVRLAHGPTSLEAMPRLGERLGLPNLYIKRDDCSGLAGGGNKARQLEFYMGAALAAGADTVLTTGAIQSNHVRTTAAACAKLGVACHVQLEDRVPGRDGLYAETGNVLLDRLFGATVHRFPVGEDEAAADAALEALAVDLARQGRRPYIIALGIDHPPLGALGYADAAAEILDQAAGQGIELGAVVTPSGSASTHAGLLTGLRLLGARLPVHGICVRRDAPSQAARVARRAAEVAAMLGRPDAVTAADVLTDDAYFGPGYGLADDGTREAVRLAARLEGVILDPVYTGKAMAGLIGLARAGVLPQDRATVFVHTGGWPAVFAYRAELAAIG